MTAPDKRPAITPDGEKSATDPKRLPAVKGQIKRGMPTTLKRAVVR